MSRTMKAVVCSVSLVAVAVGITAAGASGQPPGQDKVTICHKPGTPAEKTMQVPPTAVDGHLGHGDTEGPCQPPLTDEIIDADGIATPQSGDPAAREVQPGDTLAPFPDGGLDAGLDMFDQDGNMAWTQGVDDLHVEDPSACPTALRNTVHDLGEDCKVLDINGDLADGEPVDCDISIGASFSGMPCPPPDVKFHDADSDGAWTPGEDLVLDVNGNGIFD